MLDISLKRDKHISLDIQQGHNSIVFVRRGAVCLFDKTELANTQVAILSRSGNTLSIRASSGAEGGASVLLLSGEPIDESIVASGPFVMNTEKELAQAVRDFNSGNLGK